MKYIIILLFFVNNALADKFLTDKMSLIFVEAGSIAAKVAFCQEYGPKKHQFRVFGLKFTEAQSTATGSVMFDVCQFMYPDGPDQSCDTLKNYMMEMMWVTYSRYKSQFSDPSYNLDKGCLEFIDDINNMEIYNEAKAVVDYINENSNAENKKFFYTTQEQLQKIKDLKIQ
jgi:hypothetical protein